MLSFHQHKKKPIFNLKIYPSLTWTFTLFLWYMQVTFWCTLQLVEWFLYNLQVMASRLYIWSPYRHPPKKWEGEGWEAWHLCPQCRIPCLSLSTSSQLVSDTTCHPSILLLRIFLSVRTGLKCCLCHYCCCCYRESVFPWRPPCYRKNDHRPGSAVKALLDLLPTEHLFKLSWSMCLQGVSPGGSFVVRYKHSWHMHPLGLAQLWVPRPFCIHWSK